VCLPLVMASPAASSFDAAAPTLRVAAKLVGSRGSFQEVAGCTHDMSVQTLKDCVVGVLKHGWGVSVLPGYLRLFYGGPDEPELKEEAAVLRGKHISALSTLRAIAGDAPTAYFLVEVALLGSGAPESGATAAAGASVTNAMIPTCVRWRVVRGRSDKPSGHFLTALSSCHGWRVCFCHRISPAQVPHVHRTSAAALSA
jgi:hypothetical protein